jgi:DNA polymerase alpha-associated DNA helicase A
MHEKIMRFPSDELYESKLVAADGVKARLLKDLPYEVEKTEDTNEPLIFFDTQGGDFPEKNEEEEVDKKAGKGMMGDSKSNEMEAALVRHHVQNLVDAGVQPSDIAVITPYNAQVSIFLYHAVPFNENQPVLGQGWAEAGIYLRRTLYRCSQMVFLVF